MWYAGLSRAGHPHLLVGASSQTAALQGNCSSWQQSMDMAEAAGNERGNLARGAASGAQAPRKGCPQAGVPHPSCLPQRACRAESMLTTIRGSWVAKARKTSIDRASLGRVRWRQVCSSWQLVAFGMRTMARRSGSGAEQKARRSGLIRCRSCSWLATENPVRKWPRSCELFRS